MLTYKTIKSPTARKMFGLYRHSNGLQFTGVISTTEQGIIDYLNRTYVMEWEINDGEIQTRPSWNKDAFSIREMTIDLV